MEMKIGQVVERTNTRGQIEKYEIVQIMDICGTETAVGQIVKANGSLGQKTMYFS